MFIDVLAIVSFGNIFATQKKEAEEFWHNLLLPGEFLRLVRFYLVFDSC
jgi:type I site-specific restriction-modification system R (restriction) subunit